jgi:hypothetical protein
VTRNLTSRDESDIDGCGDGDDDDVEPRTEEEDDAESSDLVRLLQPVVPSFLSLESFDF